MLIKISNDDDDDDDDDDEQDGVRHLQLNVERVEKNEKNEPTRERGEMK